jgi:hypothetical protein
MMAIKHFVRDIEENVYKKELIYRSLIITNTVKEGKLMKHYLDQRDYGVKIIENFNETIEYTLLDERIIIMCANKFQEFITMLSKLTNGLTMFNFIAFSYNIEDAVIEQLKMFYIQSTNNNEMDTIILDKQYMQSVYLKNITV